MHDTGTCRHQTVKCDIFLVKVYDVKDYNVIITIFNYFSDISNGMKTCVWRHRNFRKILIKKNLIEAKLLLLKNDWQMNTRMKQLAKNYISTSPKCIYLLNFLRQSPNKCTLFVWSKKKNNNSHKDLGNYTLGIFYKY